MATIPVSATEVTIRFSLSADQRTLVPDENGAIVVYCPQIDSECVVNLLYTKSVIIGRRPNRRVVRHFPPMEDD